MNEDGIYQAHTRALARYRQRCNRCMTNIHHTVTYGWWIIWVREWEAALEAQRDKLLSECRAATADKIRRRKRDRGKNQPRKR